MARPTKYKPEMLERIEDYLENFKEHGEVIPTIAGLTLVLNVCEDTLYEWKKHEDKKEFSELLDKIKKKQETILVSKGLVGDFNPTIAKLILHKHNYSEKQEVAQKTDSKIEISWLE